MASRISPTRHIGDKGADALARSSRLEGLKVLEPAANPIGEAGAAAIASALPMTRLESFSLTLENEGARHIARSEPLRRLDLFSTQRLGLSVEARRLLKRHFRDNIFLY